MPTDGIFCDPQLGCSDRLVAEDLSDEQRWQLSQEFRLLEFRRPFNFSVGGNYLHYETEENYYVFINSLTSGVLLRLVAQLVHFSRLNYVPGVSDNHNVMNGTAKAIRKLRIRSGPEAPCCVYIDPNPIGEPQQPRPQLFPEPESLYA